MTEIETTTIKLPFYKQKIVNNTNSDRIYRYKEQNRENIAYFSITDITLTDNEITSITFSKEGTATTFDLTTHDIVQYIYENTNPIYTELVPSTAEGEALLYANNVLYTIIQLLIIELDLRPAEQTGGDNNGEQNGNNENTDNTDPENTDPENTDENNNQNPDNNENNENTNTTNTDNETTTNTTEPENNTNNNTNP